jgi:tripartite-type tricarboxylate transporter receptor subunit TctC
MPMRKLFSCLLAVLAIASASALAAYPERPIKFMVPWPPGGATDQVARILAVELSKAMGVTVYVENKGGAGGNIGTASFLHDKPDGYSMILATSSTNAAGPWLYKEQGFDPAKDFTPVVLVCEIPNVMVVPANSPWHTLKDIVDAARQAPGKYTYGSAGIGGSQHLAGAQFKTTANIDILHVPYKGSGPAAQDLIAGHIDMMIDTGSLGHIRGGTLRAIAVAAKQRIPALPDVPTFAEAGVPMVASAWYGVMLPAGAPAEITQRLNREINAILARPDMRERLQAMGAEVGGDSVEEFRSFATSEIARYRDIVRMSGAPKE